MRRIILAGALLAITSAAVAQTPQYPLLEIRPMAGALIPTGVQADLFRTDPFYGGQLALELKPNLHLLGSFAWSPAENKFSVFNDQSVNIYQYDVGAEFNLVRQLSPNWQLKPFLGLGVGARTYDYAARGVGAETCLAGYVAGGTEFQYKFTAFRVEARDIPYCYNNPVLDEKNTRNDLALSLGVAFHVGRHR